MSPCYRQSIKNASGCTNSTVNECHSRITDDMYEIVYCIRNLTLTLKVYDERNGQETMVMSSM